LSVVIAAGCAGKTSLVALPVGDPVGPVRGMVLDKHGRPLPDQIVAAGAEKTTTDGEGRFALPKMPAGYDLIVASPGGTHVTVFQGLTRRDPIVVHDGPRPNPRQHKAQIVVTVPAAEATMRWQVHFASPSAHAPHAGKLWTISTGKTPDRNPLVVEWDGADTFTGVLMVLSMGLDSPKASFAQRELTLRAGETAAVALAPAKVPAVRRPQAKVALPGDTAARNSPVREEFRLPGDGFALLGPGLAGAAYELPDLRSFGLQLCVEGFRWNPQLHSRRVQCGVDLGALTSFDLQRPPAFTAPAWDTFATPDVRFVWTAVPRAVYHLRLVGRSGKATAARPDIEVVTAQTTASWPDLHAVGASFPTELGVYTAAVGVSGPFASIDELAGPRGFGDLAPRDRWSAESPPLGIRTRPPGSTAEPPGLCGARPPPASDTPTDLGWGHNLCAGR